ncbi:MAG: hypothetical protein H7829_14985 [Magnetococcus sp. THC-1_WYH]
MRLLTGFGRAFQVIQNPSGESLEPLLTAVFNARPIHAREQGKSRSRAMSHLITPNTSIPSSDSHVQQGRSTTLIQIEVRIYQVKTAESLSVMARHYLEDRLKTTGGQLSSDNFAFEGFRHVLSEIEAVLFDTAYTLGQIGGSDLSDAARELAGEYPSE